MVSIDGSYLEGGGAILRVASSLSAITGKPLRVYKIRAGRRNPGLRVQHLEGLKAIASLCDGRLVNAKLGSTEIELHPGAIQPRVLNVEISTAGSVALLFQSLKLPISMAGGDVTVNVKGGATFAKWAPPLLYTKRVLLPILAQMGYSAEIDIIKHGFYPAGGAEVRIIGHPTERLISVQLTDQGNVEHIRGVSVASEHLRKAKVAERQAESVLQNICGRGMSADIAREYVPAQNPGSGVVLWTRTSRGAILAADSLGERGKPAETVGGEAVSDLVRTLETGAAVDAHLSDQLLVFLALCNNASAITTPHLSDHARTNIHVVRKFLPVEFRITENGNVRIDCSGGGASEVVRNDSAPSSGTPS